MDRNKPLWDIHVVEGLEDGRGALIPRVHHEPADGISGAALERDLRGSLARHYPAKVSCLTKTTRITELSCRGSHECRAQHVGEPAGCGGRPGEYGPGLLTSPMQDGLQGLVSLLPELAASVERFPFNRPCTGERRFCWADFSFADVQAIRAVAGTSVNDVVPAVLARAVARYVQLHRQSVEHRSSA